MIPEGTHPLRNTMTMMTDGGNTPKPKYSAAVPIGTGAAFAVNAVAGTDIEAQSGSGFRYSA